MLRYLLRPLSRGDKSRYLASAGFHELTVHRLEREILHLGREGKPFRSREHRFGRDLEIRGSLVGPNGRKLAVKTAWLVEKLQGPARFVTLIPDP